MLRKTIMFTKIPCLTVSMRVAHVVRRHVRNRFAMMMTQMVLKISRDITLRKIILRNANMVTYIRACAVGNAMRARIARDIRTMA